MPRCIKCSCELGFHDIGANKKFISRDAKEFLCKYCLAETLSITPELIDYKILQFKAWGCTLFVPD